MSEQDPRMVLRTVYLTPEIDEKLRMFAFQDNRSKNDLIRDAIAKLLGEREAPKQKKLHKPLIRKPKAGQVAPKKTLAIAE